jgi:hypothetical protein
MPPRGVAASVGSITATGADGTTYTLDIPANSLLFDMVPRVPLTSLLLRGQSDHLAGDHEDALPAMVHRPRTSP